MALTTAQKNMIDFERTLSKDLAHYKNGVRMFLEMYANEGLGNILEADLQALPGWNNVTLAEFQAARNAHNEANTALGEFTAGTIMTRIVKVLDNPVV
jgi:hypothetical protein